MTLINTSVNNKSVIDTPLTSPIVGEGQTPLQKCTGSIVSLFNIHNNDPNTQLCDTNSDNTSAYSKCSLTYGKVKALSEPNNENVYSCITYDCPTGFDREDNNMCKKPQTDAIINKESRCDERWYDWFTIPNYHLGNKFLMSNISDTKMVCKQPCDAGMLPDSMYDPINGVPITYFPRHYDEKNQCVSRKDFFNGTYENGTDFCPIATIYGLTMNDKEIQRVTNNQKGSLSSNYSQAYSDINRLNKNNIYNTITKNIPLNHFPLKYNDAMESACAVLSENNPEAVTLAYSNCVILKNSPEILRQQFITQKITNVEDRINLLKEACDISFCSKNIENENLSLAGTTEQVCFPESRKNRTTKLTASELKAIENDDPTPPLLQSKLIFIKYFIQFMIYIAITILIWLLIYFIVWRKYVTVGLGYLIVKLYKLSDKLYYGHGIYNKTYEERYRLRNLQFGDQRSIDQYKFDVLNIPLPQK